MALLVGWAYWKSLRSPRWGILCGVFYGFGLATKHNAWLIPCFLLVHYLWMRRGDFTWEPSKGSQTLRDGAPAGKAGGLPTRLRLRLRASRWPFCRWPAWAHRLVRALALAVARSGAARCANGCSGTRNTSTTTSSISAATGTCPRRQRKPVAGFLRATFPFVSTGFTVPATTLALQQPVAVVLARRRRKDAPTDEPAGIIPESPEPERAFHGCGPGADVDLAPGMFLAVQILGPIGTLALPSTPIFGGVKHFLAAMPFLAMLAGVGNGLGHAPGDVAGASFAASPCLARSLAGLLCLPAWPRPSARILTAWATTISWSAGSPVAQTLGMNRQFWGYSVLPLLPWMKAHRPPSNRVYWHDVLHDAVMMYVRDGRLPLGIGDTGVGESVVAQSDLGLVILEKHFAVYEYLHWEAFQTTQPAQVYAHEGVPFVVVYQRKAPPPRQEPLPP